VTAASPEKLRSRATPAAVAADGRSASATATLGAGTSGRRRRHHPAKAPAVALLLLLHRKAAVPERARPAPGAPAGEEPRRDDPTGGRVPRDAAPARAADGPSIQAVLSQGWLADVPPGVLSGPFTAKGSGEEPDEALKEMSLTASQRTVIDALVAERDAQLQDIRREIQGHPPGREDVDRLSAKAAAAQERCMGSIRGTLLPDQQERFDGLVKSGRWGGYTLLIPLAR